MAASSVERAYLVGLDLETTGLKLESPVGAYFDEILEVSAVGFQMSNLKRVAETTWLIRPSDLKKVTVKTAKINGISRDVVKDRPEFHEVAVEIYRALHGNIWFGHNVKSFDHRALNVAFKRAGMQPPKPLYVIDTLHVFPRFFKKNLPNKKLATFMDYFELGQQAHRALDDVNDLFDVFQRVATVRFLEEIIPSEILAPPQAEGVITRAAQGLLEKRVEMHQNAPGGMPAQLYQNPWAPVEEVPAGTPAQQFLISSVHVEEVPPQKPWSPVEEVPAGMPAQQFPKSWASVAAAPPLILPEDPWASLPDLLHVQLNEEGHSAEAEDQPLPQAMSGVVEATAVEDMGPPEELTRQLILQQNLAGARPFPVEARGTLRGGPLAERSLNAEMSQHDVEAGDWPVSRALYGLMEEIGIPADVGLSADSSAGVQLKRKPEERQECSVSRPFLGPIGAGLQGVADHELAAAEVADLAPVLTVQSGRPSWMLSWQGQEFVWRMERGTVTSTVHENGPYSVDSSGRPSFRILVRLPPPAANFVRNVSTLMESTTRQQQHQHQQEQHHTTSTPWESPLMPSRDLMGCPHHTIRLKILIDGEGRADSPASYLTRFTEAPGVATRAPGVFPPRAVSVPSFAQALPNRSLISARVRFKSYLIPGQRSGLRLVAEEITLLRHGP